ncbi:MAG: EFR1 family ferrodoxin [Mogibacterium sp.]|nr:EFR1 family ferrodoxin [Mogibacterium sp.]
MKENIIFCYSGTGNCLDMAKNIAKELGDTDIVMMRKYPAVTDVREAKRVGFIFPCYGGGLPGHVERYLHDIKVSPDAYTFGIAQCAAYKGEGLSKLNALIPLDYWAAVSHQCTCIWLFPHDLMIPKMGAEAAQARSEEFASKIAADVKAGVKTKKKLGKALANKVEHAKWPVIARKKGQSLKASDKCVQCGQCAKICPTENIRYAGKAVVFGDKCISCCGCLQYCPQEAISMGKVTEKREHYHNPNVTADELTQEIISY